ncbi:MAG: phage/plasmid primase, P4 family [Ahrensia sp.]|nr:phage/plasmid primase, P4 family [Ahrensia sp.]
MNKHVKNTVPADVAAQIAAAESQCVNVSGDAPAFAPPSGDKPAFDLEVVEYCAGLDRSDTDNAVRLKLHFGQDLIVMAQEGAEKPPYAVWAGTHWDFGNGPQLALKTAQKLGAAIALEVNYLGMSKSQLADVAAAEEIEQQEANGEAVNPSDKSKIIQRAEKAKEAFNKIKLRKLAFAEVSKNSGRMKSALECLVPHVLADADTFNADPHRFACLSHTICFETSKMMVDNPAHAKDDMAPIKIEKIVAKVVAHKGHYRQDRITTVVPVAYDPAAPYPKWQAWLEEFSPNPSVRRMLQVATGLGLLGVTVQRLFFHYGKGSNGKSVFMETVGRVLGDMCVSLPAESITGKQNGSGGPSPDLARLYGKRFLRVAELPQNEELRIELVKKLTGGEKFPVRDLFKGYFDFTPIFVAHMSGNGYPKTQETDNGTWRRLVVVKWPKTIPTDQQRDFEDVLADFKPEYSGILNWMIEGARIFLEEGLDIAQESIEETQKYRVDMDPLAGFVGQCLEPCDKSTEGIQASQMYGMYTLWCSENGAAPISMTGFGKKLNGYSLPGGGSITRDDQRIRHYHGVKIKYQPNGAPNASEKYPDGYGG